MNFGFPGPEDVVTLGPEDDITLTFNEPIDGGGLGTGNFELRSEVNKLNLTHDASLSFGGSTSDYVDLGSYITLANKSFTIEFLGPAAPGVSGGGDLLPWHHFK